jgi:hypothetical protein
MKILLVTIQNANNYGAILQAYAMQKTLQNYGEVKILNYDNRHIGIDFDLVRVKPTIHGLLGMGKDLLRIIPRKKALNRFTLFINKYINLTEKVTKEDIEQLENLFDLYIAGSDQIWNPRCISEKGKIDDIYFLNFANKSKIKASFSSSFGSYKFNKKEEIQIQNLLKDFKSISVRELDSKNYLSNLLKKDIFHTLDPTLLLNKEEWIESFNLKKKNDEKYILVYTVPKTKLINHVTTKINEKLKLKVIAIDQGLTTIATVDKQIRDAGPLEYLELFLNAEFIITDSFHGTCFSLNFNKNFVSVAPGIHSNRIESLLNSVDLSNQLIKDELDLVKINLDLCYQDINKKLNVSRNAAIQYLTNIFR